MQIIVEISISFRLQKNCDGMWVVFDASKSNTNLTKDVNNENLTLNPEPREETLDRSRTTIFAIAFYCLHIILFRPNLII